MIIDIKIQADVTQQLKASLHFLSKPCISCELFSIQASNGNYLSFIKISA